MMYYRVKECEYNEHWRILCRNGKGLIYHELIDNELYTEKELQKIGAIDYESNSAFDIVSIHKARTYFSFGTRFECRAEV